MGRPPIDDPAYKHWDEDEARLLKRVVFYLGFADGSTAKQMYENHISTSRYSFHEFVYQLTRFSLYCLIDKDKLDVYHYYNRREGPTHLIDKWRDSYDRDVIDLIYKEKKFNESMGKVWISKSKANLCLTTN